MRKLLMVLVMVTGCSMFTAPEPEPLPVGALFLNPPPYFESLWRQVEGCSGLKGDFHAVSFYVVHADTPFVIPNSQPGIAFYQVHSHRIILAHWQLQTTEDSVVIAAGYEPWRFAIIRHEMLHALIRGPGHPPEFFKDKCAGVIVPG